MTTGRINQVAPRAGVPVPRPSVRAPLRCPRSPAAAGPARSAHPAGRPGVQWGPYHGGKRQRARPGGEHPADAAGAWSGRRHAGVRSPVGSVRPRRTDWLTDRLTARPPTDPGPPPLPPASWARSRPGGRDLASGPGGSRPVPAAAPPAALAFSSRLLPADPPRLLPGGPPPGPASGMARVSPSAAWAAARPAPPPPRRGWRGGAVGSRRRPTGRPASRPAWAKPVAGRSPWSGAGRSGSGGSGSTARASSLIAWGVRDPARGRGGPAPTPPG